MEFLRGRSPDGLSKVTVSSPVRQLFWNQQWLCRLSQLFLGQLVLWMVLMEMNPVWSLSLLTERSPASKQDFPKAKLLGIEPLTSARYQDRSKADGFKSALPNYDQSSHETNSSDISLSIEVDQPLSTQSEKELRLPGAQSRSLRGFSTQTSQSFAAEKLSLPDRPSSGATSACWKLQLQSSCRFSSGKVRLDLDQPTLSQVPLGLPDQVPIESAPIAQPGLEPDPELGVILASPIQEIDPELGLPRLRERILEPLPSPSAARQPSVYLITRVDYFRTTNVFSGIDPVDDGLIRSGLTLFYAPAIGRNTYLVTSIDGNLVRYGNLGNLNYNELRLRAGVLQRLTPRTFGEIGWSNQQLFATREGLQDAFRGDRFLNDHAIRFELSRQDALSKKLSLNTFYQFRASFADPNDRSRLINSFITSLSYGLSPNLQTAIDYQLAWSHFTQQPRDDVYHQLVARLTYTITAQSQLNVFSGFSFGHSSDSRINFDGFILGVGVVLNLPLF